MLLAYTYQYLMLDSRKVSFPLSGTGHCQHHGQKALPGVLGYFQLSFPSLSN